MDPPSLDRLHRTKGRSFAAPVRDRVEFSFTERQQDPVRTRPSIRTATRPLCKHWNETEKLVAYAPRRRVPRRFANEPRGEDKGDSRREGGRDKAARDWNQRRRGEGEVREPVVEPVSSREIAAGQLEIPLTMSPPVGRPLYDLPALTWRSTLRSRRRAALCFDIRINRDRPRIQFHRSPTARSKILSSPTPSPDKRNRSLRVPKVASGRDSNRYQGFLSSSNHRDGNIVGRESSRGQRWEDNVRAAFRWKLIKR